MVGGRTSISEGPLALRKNRRTR